MRLGLLGLAQCIEAIRDRAGEIGMGRVDGGVDHGDEHVGAPGEAMGIGQAELADHVLPCRVVLRRGDRRDGLGRGRAGRGGRCALREHEDVVRLREGDDAVALERLDHLPHGLPGGDAQLQHALARDRLRADERQPEAPQDRVELSVRDAGIDLDHHLIRDETGLVERRNAARPAVRAQRLPDLPRLLALRTRNGLLDDDRVLGQRRERDLPVLEDVAKHERREVAEAG